MSVKNMLKTFARDERGSFSIEAILMFPMLVWAFMALYVFFEGLRESNINLKATYTVADLLSREDNEVDQLYISNMNVIYQWLARSQSNVRMRMSVVHYDEATDSHNLYCTIGVGVDGEVPGRVEVTVTPQVTVNAEPTAGKLVETRVDY